MRVSKASFKSGQTISKANPGKVSTMYDVNKGGNPLGVKIGVKYDDEDEEEEYEDEVDPDNVPRNQLLPNTAEVLG